MGWEPWHGWLIAAVLLVWILGGLAAWVISERAVNGWKRHRARSSR